VTVTRHLLVAIASIRAMTAMARAPAEENVVSSWPAGTPAGDQIDGDRARQEHHGRAVSLAVRLAGQGTVAGRAGGNDRVVTQAPAARQRPRGGQMR
jgi:hypothetical protein